MGETNKPITIDLPEGVPVDVILRPHESDRTGRHRRPAPPVPSRGQPRARHRAGRDRARQAVAPAAGRRPRALTRDPGNKRRDWAREQDLVYVEAADVSSYEETASRTLQQVAQAHVPLEGPRMPASSRWRPSDGGKEHLAIVVGEIDPTEPVLIRLHSECFTGDLLGSLRCDCGVQLRSAIAEIARQGSGVLLYLAQEGRGIGLVNKLRAYELQDDGFDTIDANEQLGFDADERIYAPAATMLSRRASSACG